ncbi:hypothetical protein CAEBREN_08236 [Caenorhabditis brenneri]|uniref:Uncharacterized protein n=1 Tax=Caenorhabditis brenneri TaxID=135651 RepID=G0MWG5_CAEBE|nr:hypothetical protein CAEBREN_08236 [Caenorhabditis brenneri]
MQSIIEYNRNRVKEPLGELDDMLIGPCYDDERDQHTEFRGRGELAAAERADRQMRETHDGDIRIFLDACPHLDPVRALELLSELPLTEAIQRGLNMIMTPKEHVPRWVEKQLGDPTDLRFVADNAIIDSIEEERDRLGAQYEGPPILRIREIVEGRVAAENPQEVETAHIKVEWPEPIVAARLRAARLDVRRKQKASSASTDCQAKRARK